MPNNALLDTIGAPATDIASNWGAPPPSNTHARAHSSSTKKLPFIKQEQRGMVIRGDCRQGGRNEIKRTRKTDEVDGLERF